MSVCVCVCVCVCVYVCLSLWEGGVDTCVIACIMCVQERRGRGEEVVGN